VILVGEIRDKETAEIAMEAALTGHLLVSTLHTNDAPSTIARFTEMGAEPFNISASLVCVCAQRLLRRVCEACSRRYTTYERIEETVRLQVIKKDGTRVPFDRNKLLSGVQKAMYKRPVAGELVAKMVDAVEEELARTGLRIPPR